MPRDITLGFHPQALRARGSLEPPSVGGFPRYAGGVERRVVTAAYADPSFVAGQPPTVNQQVFAGIFYGFRMKPVAVTSTGAKQAFASPRTVWLRGLSTAEGGDGGTWVLPVSDNGWVPQPFSVLQLGVESLGATASDTWEIWASRQPLPGDLAAGSPFEAGYQQDPSTGLWVTPDFVNPTVKLNTSSITYTTTAAVTAIPPFPPRPGEIVSIDFQNQDTTLSIMLQTAPVFPGPIKLTPGQVYSTSYTGQWYASALSGSPVLHAIAYWR